MDPRWDEKLLAHDDASIFHTTAWARVLKESYGYTCCYLAEMDGDRFSILMPLMDVRSMLTGNRGISLPFTDFCEPLMNGPKITMTTSPAPSPLPPGDDQVTAGISSPPQAGERIKVRGPEPLPETVNKAGNTAGEMPLDSLIDLGHKRGWKYFEVRGGARIFGNAQPSMTVLSHTLDLTLPEEALFAKIKESTRRNIKKAKREGVEVSIGTSGEMVDDFYRLNCLTRRDHGLPPQPLSFFRNLHKYIFEQGSGCIALATLRGQCIGGAVYLHFGREALYKYGASDNRFLSLRPNDLVMWEAIRWYRAQGFRRLGFGRTELQHEGLRRYKLAWGVEEQVKPYYRYNLETGTFGKSKLKGPGASSAIFRRLPIFASRAIGEALYRHVA